MQPVRPNYFQHPQFSEDLLNKVGQYLPRAERNKLRKVDRQFAGVFSTRPAFIYRIKNKLTLTCNLTKKKKSDITTFGIFSNSFGDIETDDLEEHLYHYLFVSLRSFKAWLEDNAEDVYDSLPLDVRLSLEGIGNLFGRSPMTQFASLAIRLSRTLLNVELDLAPINLTHAASLWSSEDLKRDIKSRGNILPFTLPREIKYAPSQEEVRGLTGEFAPVMDFSPQMVQILGSMGGEDPLQNFQKLFSYTLTHEFNVETFKVANAL